MDWFGLVVGAVSGLFGGAAGGVLTAARIARGTQRGQDQFAAEARARGVIRIYRATLQWDAAQLPKIDRYPDEYAGIAGQERLAFEIVRELPAMRPRIAARVDGKLEPLFGKLALALARQRASIDQARFDPDKEAQRRMLVGLQIIKGTPGDDESVLQDILRDQNSRSGTQESHDKAIAVLDDLEELLVPRADRKQLRAEKARIDEATRRGIGTE